MCAVRDKKSTDSLHFSTFRLHYSAQLSPAHRKGIPRRATHLLAALAQERPGDSHSIPNGTKQTKNIFANDWTTALAWPFEWRRTRHFSIPKMWHVPLNADRPPLMDGWPDGIVRCFPIELFTLRRSKELSEALFVLLSILVAMQTNGRTPFLLSIKMFHL